MAQIVVIGDTVYAVIDHKAEITQSSTSDLVADVVDIATASARVDAEVKQLHLNDLPPIHQQPQAHVNQNVNIPQNAPLQQQQQPLQQQAQPEVVPEPADPERINNRVAAWIWNLCQILILVYMFHSVVSATALSILLLMFVGQYVLVMPAMQDIRPQTLLGSVVHFVLSFVQSLFQNMPPHAVE